MGVVLSSPAISPFQTVISPSAQLLLETFSYEWTALDVIAGYAAMPFVPTANAYSICGSWHPSTLNNFIDMAFLVHLGSYYQCIGVSSSYLDSQANLLAGDFLTFTLISRIP